MDRRDGEFSRQPQRPQRDLGITARIMDVEVDLVYYPTTENAVDIFTKGLGRDLLDRHLHRFGIGPKM